MKHAIKIEELDISKETADQYLEVMHDFFSELSFSKDRIDAFECRRRGGFAPYSHNHGGLDAVTYRDQYGACEDTGFENTDKVLTKYYQYNLNDFLESNKINELTDEYHELFDEYMQSDNSTIKFQARIMMTSETTANVDFYVSASDTPYHRSSDDKFETEIKFKTPEGMKRKLKTLLKHNFVKCLKKNVREGF